jgi:hypothetical protein
MILKIAAEVLTGILALMYTTNIVALNNRTRALKIHGEIPESAGLFMLNCKVVITFLTGIGFVCAFVGFFFTNPLLSYLAASGALAFFLFYIVEVVLWGRSYPKVWGGFLTFGLVTLLLGLYHFLCARGV